jgi:hypothetical protein
MNDLQRLISNNMELLDAELETKEDLAAHKLARQQEALAEIYGEIEPAIVDAGYCIALFQLPKHHTYKPKCYEDQWDGASDEMAKMIKIEFEYATCLKDTGESENYYAPHVHNGEHCGGNEPAYIKISWDDARGVYYLVPNVAYNYNKERKDVDKRTYLELQGTKSMIVVRLAVILASVMRLERTFNAAAAANEGKEHE